MKAIGTLALLAAAVATGACSTLDKRESNADRRARYEAAAGETVAHFNYFSLQSWEGLGDDKLAIWTRPKEAWLLTVARPCWDLEYANSIALSPVVGSSVSTFDYVMARGDRCRILSIRPLDVDKLRQSRPK